MILYLNIFPILSLELSLVGNLVHSFGESATEIRQFNPGLISGMFDLLRYLFFFRIMTLFQYFKNHEHSKASKYILLTNE